MQTLQLGWQMTKEGILFPIFSLLTPHWQSQCNNIVTDFTQWYITITESDTCRLLTPNRTTLWLPYPPYNIHSLQQTCRNSRIMTSSYNLYFFDTGIFYLMFWTLYCKKKLKYQYQYIDLRLANTYVFLNRYYIIYL